MSRLTQTLKPLARMNWTLTVMAILLLIIGVFFVYSSCYVSDDIPVRQLHRKQMVWIAVGCICHFGMALLDYRRLRKLAWWLYALSLGLLGLVLVAGTTIYGARRWFMIFGVGVQPSELAKVATILVLARRLSRPGENLNRWTAILEILVIVLAPVVLIMQEPDLGTSMIFIPVAMFMMFVGGVSLRRLAILAGVGLTAISILLGALFLPARLGVSETGQAQIMKVLGVSEYQRERLTVFFYPDRDPLGAGWNKRQSEIAVGSGGLWGKGFRKGTQNILGFLPRTVAPTDFIFSVIAEEKGFVGSSAVLLLFGVLLVSGMQAAVKAPDKMGRLLCTGVVTMVFVHVFVNMAMTVGLMPITGLPLPLLSYGGSFMVVMMAALGIVQSVHIRMRRPGVVFEQCSLWAGR